MGVARRRRAGAHEVDADARVIGLDQLVEAYDAGISVHLVCPGAPSPCYAHAIVACIAVNKSARQRKRACPAD